MKDLAVKHERYKTLCRQVFNTSDGKELMSHFDALFVNVRLYGSTDRDTAYAVAQRDLIIEIKDHANITNYIEIEEE